MLKEKCEELEDTLRMVNDEKEAAQFRNKKEVNAAGSFVDCDKSDSHN